VRDDLNIGASDLVDAVLSSDSWIDQVTASEAKRGAVSEHLVHILARWPCTLVLSVDDRVGRLLAVFIPPVINEVGPELEGSPHIEVMSRVLLADASTVRAQRLSERRGDKILEDLPHLYDQAVGPDHAAVVKLIGIAAQDQLCKSQRGVKAGIEPRRLPFGQGLRQRWPLDSVEPDSKVL